MELVSGDYRGGGGVKMRDVLHYNETRLYDKFMPVNSSYLFSQ